MSKSEMTYDDLVDRVKVLEKENAELKQKIRELTGGGDLAMSASIIQDALEVGRKHARHVKHGSSWKPGENI